VKGEHIKDAANAAFQGKMDAAARGDPDASPPPHLPLCDMKDGHVKDAAQGIAEDVPQDVAQDLAFEARAARALIAKPQPPQPPSWCSSR